MNFVLILKIPSGQGKPSSIVIVKMLKILKIKFKKLQALVILLGLEPRPVPCGDIIQSFRPVSHAVYGNIP